MKKILAFTLILALALSLAACGGDQAAAPAPAAPAAESSAAPAPAPAPAPPKTESKADLANPEYTPEQVAVAEKFAAMTDRYQKLADTINADEKLLAVDELVNTMNTLVAAINEDDALFVDPANLTPEVLKNLEEGVVLSNTFLDELEAMVSNYAGKKTVTVPVEIVNATGVEIHSLSMSPANDTNWGGNLLDAPLAANESGVTKMTFTEDTLIWDLQAADAEGTAIEFMGLDFSGVSTESAKLMLEAAADGTFTAAFAA